MHLCHPLPTSLCRLDQGQATLQQAQSSFDYSRAGCNAKQETPTFVPTAMSGTMLWREKETSAPWGLEGPLPVGQGSEPPIESPLERGPPLSSEPLPPSMQDPAPAFKHIKAATFYKVYQ